jgi:hypothetical protein
MNKGFIIRFLINMSVLASGFGLSLFYVVRIDYFDILMILFGLIATLIFVPKQYWIRVFAFTFLMAGLFGFGRIGLDIGHRVENVEGVVWSKYVHDLIVYFLYGAVWLIWWMKDSRASKKLKGRAP